MILTRRRLERNLSRRCAIAFNRILPIASAVTSQVHEADDKYVRPPCIMVVAGSDSGGEVIKILNTEHNTYAWTSIITY